MSTRGLEGVIAAESSISSIIDGVLTYRGIDIDDLASHASFEEVIYLLWYGKLPNQSELDQLTKQLAENASIPQELIDQIRLFPNNIHPMGALRTAISALGLFDQEAEEMDDDSNIRKAICIQAKIGTIVTAFARIRAGKDPIAPRSDLGVAANFLYMLTGEEPSAISVEAFNKALVLHADHEFNASTFTARVTVATLSDMYSGITSAIGALKGPLHGGANEQVMATLEAIGEVDKAEGYILNALANKEKIMGFGHRVYKDGDPRAKHLKEMSKALTELTGQPKWYDMSVKINEVVEREKGLKPNVDFYSASVYYSLGIERDLFTPIFAVSRASGWIGHILEQYANNRLIRPRADYVGPQKQDYVPIHQR
ncbi:citrate synthase [Caldalkalibacillus mannanilyticus]|uniref:citrate synthase n=1 Tax=Caldalkalibacillus mannanilyticus TaxID=1418 RepID=UPI00046A92D1|nr:citrate synthase [Caldalkalibacillus mannanilyticus]